MSSSGQIVNLVDPTIAQDAATKSYVDTKFNNVPTPTNTNDAANKGYVDTATTNMATTSSVSTAITTALGSSGTQENRPTVTRGDTTNATHYLTFIDGNDIASDGSSKRALMRCDSSLYYNPSTNTLNAGTFSGNLSGNASNASNATTATTATTAENINNSGNSTFTTGGQERMRITSTGRIGIGTTNPAFPLDVVGSVSYTLSGSPAFFDGLGPVPRYAGGLTMAVTMRTSNTIECGAAIIFTSDKRIKKNVKDLDGDTALLQIRQIRPKIYNYIDYSTKGTADVYGFIAQDVKDIILHSTTCSKDYIPNFYCKGNICAIDASNNIYEISSENDLSFEKVIDDSGNEVIFHKVKIYGYDNTEYFCCVTHVNNLKNIVVTLEKEFNFSNKQEEYNKIFIYGQQIYDFHSLEKNAIWTVATAALQEVDRQQQADKARIAELEATVAAQQSLINDILDRLKTLEKV